MTTSLTKPVTYEEFIEWFPYDGKQYELHDGVIVEMAPYGFVSLTGQKLTPLRVRHSPTEGNPPSGVDSPPTDSPPSGDHEKVVGFLTVEIAVQFRQNQLPYTIPKTAFVRTPSVLSVYSPDVLLLNLDNIDNIDLEPLWKKESTVTDAASVPLVVEVVSTNWRDDYLISCTFTYTYGKIKNLRYKTTVLMFAFNVKPILIALY